MQNFDLRKLNSATKYPSIPTFHELGPGGVLDNGNHVPKSIEDMYQFLQTVAKGTQAGIDPDTQGRPEGIVLRTADRSIIAKARYRSYERTLKEGTR